jgi:hypothetical protein
MRYRFWRVIVIVSFFQVFFLQAAQAAVVGRFQAVEGRVDILTGGQLPASPAKVDEGVEPGDVVRTKTRSRAQLRFVDDTTLSLAPESRVVIEEYLYAAGKNRRRAVLRVLQGLVLTVVTRLWQTQEPDFLMKTHTAIMGVRGTRWYTYLLPQAKEIYTEKGRLEVWNSNEKIPGRVITEEMQYTRVESNTPPTLPVAFGPEDLKFLKNRVTPGKGVDSSGLDSPAKYISGTIVSSLGNRSPGLINNILLDRNLLGSIRQSKVVQNLVSGINVPPILKSIRPDRELNLGLRDSILNRTTGPGLNITPGLRSGPDRNFSIKR